MIISTFIKSKKKMIEQTLNGRDIFITKLPDGTYFVMCDGEYVTLDERPVTDQDIANHKYMVIQRTGARLGDILVDLMMPLLNPEPKK